jgi:[glutamine synthetase] adenylyltransferase / [glutamine synthetase]-adenylyl-L-tyrosine phosphorylase
LSNLGTAKALITARAQELGQGAENTLIAGALMASDFVYQWLRAKPEWIVNLAAPPPILAAAGALSSKDLCAFRVRRSLAQIALECAGGISVEQSLQYASDTAVQCIQAALAQAQSEHQQRFGMPADEHGTPTAVVVFGMGKLGGHELNFSSDIDLIVSFAAMGETIGGARALDNQEYFARITRRTAQLLSELTEYGSCYRVDLRLRPFGSAGQAALSFGAMEDYYQREGRDWERYAWIKARAVAGSDEAGAVLLARLRPFVYRKYLDFAAFEGMREMKALVDAQVQAEGMEQNLKLGAGGIREIEFLVQMEQLIRGGRDAQLRVQGTLPAIAALCAADAFTQAEAESIRADYLFLRRLENRVQMMLDQQTHTMPNDPLLQTRIALSLDFADCTHMQSAIADVRARVHARFLQAVRLPGSGQDRDPNLANNLASNLDAIANRLPMDQALMFWQSISGPQNDDVRKPSQISDSLWQALRAFAESSAVQNLSARGRQRLDRVVPLLWSFAVATTAPEETALRLIAFLSAISTRTAYLALISEKPSVAQRLVTLFAQSAWLAQLITSTPILLDELLDTRRLEQPYDLKSLHAAAHAELRALESSTSGAERARVTQEPDDPEQIFEQLITFKHSVQLRIATQFLSGQIDALGAVRAQSDLADVLIENVLMVAHKEMQAQFGRLSVEPAQDFETAGISGFAILGYGSLGGRELNFASDLDLVFVYNDSLTSQETTGPKVIDGQRYFVRLAQRVISLLTTATRFGPLYQVDMRLRPNGNKGLLVIGMDAYQQYQQAEAWAWEHQALVRARFVAGSPLLAAAFAALRAQVLGKHRDAAVVAAEIARMRARMRAELDRTDATLFDLKQGQGGLVDLEFECQRLVLSSAQTQAKTQAKKQAWPAETHALLAQLMPEKAQQHERLLALALRQTLNSQARLVPHAELGFLAV